VRATATAISRATKPKTQRMVPSPSSVHPQARVTELGDTASDAGAMDARPALARGMHDVAWR